MLSIHLFLRLSNLQWQQGHEKDNEYFQKALWRIISSIPILEDHSDKIYVIIMEEIEYAGPRGIAPYLSGNILDGMLEGRRLVLCHILYRIWQLLMADPNFDKVLPLEPGPSTPSPSHTPPIGGKLIEPDVYITVYAKYPEWMQQTHEAISIPNNFVRYPGMKENPKWPEFVPEGMITITDPRHTYWSGQVKIANEDTDKNA